MKIRTGIGMDAHRFAESGQLVLGGVEIEYPRGLEGHSDADVLTHAIADALLGAAGLEDIGHYFPDSEPEWEDASSLDILNDVAGMVRKRGCEIGNVDAVVVTEEPRISHYREEIRSRLACAIDIPAEAVTVRGTTTEGMGFTGSGEGIAVLATCLVECTGILNDLDL